MITELDIYWIGKSTLYYKPQSISFFALKKLRQMVKTFLIKYQVYLNGVHFIV